MARKEYYPDVTLNGGYYNMGRMPDMYQFGVDIRLPLWFARNTRRAFATVWRLGLAGL